MMITVLARAIVRIALAASLCGSAHALAAPAWISVDGAHLRAGAKALQLRGVNLGNWMVQEDFLFGLHGTHSQMRDAIGTLLGGRAPLFWEAYEEQYFQDADAAWLQARHYNLLRVPLSQNRLEDPNHPGMYDTAALARLDRLIERCARHGIWVLLDLHAVTGGQARENYADATSGEPLFWRQADLRERATRLWEALALRYRDNSSVAGYDLINEPQTEGHTPLLTQWLHTTLQRVRAIDRRHVVWLSGDEWGGGLVGLAPALWRDPQLAFQFHIYPGWTYPWSRMHAYPDSVDGVRYDAAWLRQRLAAMIAFGRYHPVLLGETGLSVQPGGAVHEAHLRAALGDLLALADAQQWSWAQWTYKDIGQMGMLAPRADQPWQQLINAPAAQAARASLAALMSVRGVAASPATPPALPALIGSLAPGSDSDLRIVGIKVRRAMDELLSRAIAAPMATLSDEALRALAGSFSFVNCQENPAVTAPFAYAAAAAASAASTSMASPTAAPIGQGRYHPSTGARQHAQ